MGGGEGKGQTREGLEAQGDLGGRVDQETEEVGWGREGGGGHSLEWRG